MKLYRFKTFRTSYFFPARSKGHEFLYGLYTPMGSMLSKIYWKLFCNCSVVRWLNIAKNMDKQFPYSRIINLMPKGAIVSFNLGTPGPEQKISMLGLEPDGKHFFAKFSTKEGAIALSRNELKVLEVLRGKGLAPELYDYKDTDKYVFFRTSCIDGINPISLSIDNNIVGLAIKVSCVSQKEGALKTSFSHGDFTPWNIIINPTGEYKLIDWEMAGQRILGYDVFTYITQVAALLSTESSLKVRIDQYKEYIDSYFSYFGVKDWSPYLRAFAIEKIAYEQSKDNIELVKKIESLL